MLVLLDTNIIIHREASTIHNQNIGTLYFWLDKLHHTKCVHPLTIAELAKHHDKKTVKSMNLKLSAYHLIETPANLHVDVKQISDREDINDNDLEDTKLLNEVYCDRVDILISEDRKIHNKAIKLGIQDRVFRIDTFLEKLVSENPDLVDYKVQSVRYEYFGNIDLHDEFFDSFRGDYVGFDTWFNKKAGKNEKAYVYHEDGALKAFLYLKTETEGENYSNIDPPFNQKVRLKIGTFKVVSNGLRIGERFLKIIFDNAWKLKVSEIYVTIFETRPELLSLVSLLEKFGFKFHGYKTSESGEEGVYVRDFEKQSNEYNPSLTYPWMSKTSSVFIVPINPKYHTRLLPDSILNTEKPDEFIDSEPYRNAISKVYVSHSSTRGLQSGDILVFYRSGGMYEGVVTTLGIVEEVIIPDNVEHLIEICKKRSVLSEKEIKEFWERYPNRKPFAINFLYAFSFKKKMTLKNMLDNKILPNMEHVKTINLISRDSLKELILSCKV